MINPILTVICHVDGLESMGELAREEFGCDSLGRRWMCGMYDVEQLKSATTDDELSDLLHEIEPLARAFGPTEDAAEHNARLEAERNGWQVIDWSDLIPSE